MPLNALHRALASFFTFDGDAGAEVESTRSGCGCEEPRRPTLLFGHQLANNDRLLDANNGNQHFKCCAESLIHRFTMAKLTLLNLLVYLTCFYWGHCFSGIRGRASQRRIILTIVLLPLSILAEQTFFFNANFHGFRWDSLALALWSVRIASEKYFLIFSPSSIFFNGSSSLRRHFNNKKKQISSLLGGHMNLFCSFVRPTLRRGEKYFRSRSSPKNSLRLLHHFGSRAAESPVLVAMTSTSIIIITEKLREKSMDALLSEYAPIHRELIHRVFGSNVRAH